MNAYTPSIYGVGFSYPFRLDAAGVRPAMSRDEQLVREAMEVLLGTAVGEEPFLVRNGIPYGTRARLAVFEPVGIARDIIRYDVRRALDTWEPRIEVIDVQTDEVQLPRGKAVLGVVDFRYRTTSRVDNLVVPYMLKQKSQ